MRVTRLTAVFVAILATALLQAQQPPTTTPPQAPSDQTPPPVLSGTAAGAYERHDVLPYVNLYLPEGEASVRLRKLIRNVLFESQIDYRFVNGDISTFLRYKYYARNFTYRLGVFDQIGFPDLGSSSKQEFQRVRGGLLLFEVPRDYNNRYFWLVQDDRLTFGDVTHPDNRKNNIYTKVGYQYGTQFDERLNSIVGETRGRILPVLTAFRDLGPQKTGIAAAVTESARIATGDYRYTKLEGEALRRFDLTGTGTTFIVSRLHGGFFLNRGHSTTYNPLTDPVFAQYTIPQYELFRLGGRDAMKAFSDKVETEGTHEAHLTNEYFAPVFRNRDYRTGVVHWNTMYAVGYLGAGSVGYEYRALPKANNLFVDAGLGTEMGITVRDYDVLLSVLYAHSIKAPDGLTGGKFRFSIRTTH
jgi:hypothetical protein